MLEEIYEKVYMSPLPPPKISLKHDWKREWCLEDAQRSEGQVVLQSRSFQSNQPIPNPSNPLLEPIERSNPLLELTREPCKMKEKRPVPRRSVHVLFTKKLSKPIERFNPFLEKVEPKHVHLMTASVLTLKWRMVERGNPLLKHTENVPDGCQTLSCHESISLNVGDETIRDRTGQPVVNHDESSHEQTMLNEVNMDFRIPGLPHSVVKHAEGSRVRELVKKIENHPD